VRALEGDRGRINAGQIASSINPDDVHRARTSLVTLENTCNRGGGSCYDLREIEKIRQVCTDNQLKLHLDGARLFNALVATGQNASDFGSLFDSISICLNKGLGCPIGSVLTGTAAFIRQARRVRKVFGGGMRQGGFMAAAGIYALDNNIKRLAEDHAHARRIASALEKKDFVLRMMPVETNIVIFEADPQGCARALAQKLKEKGVLVIAISPSQIRFVTHLDISREMVDRTVEVIEQL
jgi:threonine aldolase